MEIQTFSQGVIMTRVITKPVKKPGGGTGGN